MFPPRLGCVTLGKYISSLMLSSSFLKWDDGAYIPGSLGRLKVMTHAECPVVAGTEQAADERSFPNFPPQSRSCSGSPGAAAACFIFPDAPWCFAVLRTRCAPPPPSADSQAGKRLWEASLDGQYHSQVAIWMGRARGLPSGRRAMGPHPPI